jgi:hypothetical protein
MKHASVTARSRNSPPEALGCVGQPDHSPPAILNLAYLFSVWHVEVDRQS